MKAALLLANLLALNACAFDRGTVERIYDGNQVRGRYIAPEAYAAYARGTYLQRRGDADAASEWFRSALEFDSEAADAWIGLGAAECQRRQTKAAEHAFARAEQLAPMSAELYRERALCARARRDWERAVAWSERAAALDPDAEDNTLLLIDVYRSTGRRADAQRWLHGALARFPRSPAVRRVALTSALEQKQYGLATVYLEDWWRLVPERQSQMTRLHPSLTVWRLIDEPLRDGRLTLARARANTLGVSAAELALRAVLLGSASVARAQAELVLQADTRSGDGWIAWLTALELRGDETELARALSAPSSELTAPGPLAQRLFAALLLRRSGPRAAAAWLRTWQPLPPPSDALELALDRYLTASALQSPASAAPPDGTAPPSAAPPAAGSPALGAPASASDAR